MASFSDIVKSQRSKGAGVVGSLATAIAQSSLQKIDPRNILFSRTGTMASLFPFLKGYQAKTGQTKSIAPKLQPIGTQAFDKETVSRIQKIDINTRINAKNSMVLPMMARDMNLMRQNIQKMTKQSTGSSVRKADMFFKRSPERESAYKSAEKKEGGSLIGDIISGAGSLAGGALSATGGLFGGLFKGLLPGLGILGLIGGTFLISKLPKIFGPVFSGIGNIFAEIGNIALSSLKAFFKMDQDRPFFEQVSEKIKSMLGIEPGKNLAGEIARILDENLKTGDFFKNALVTVVSTFEKIGIYADAFYKESLLIFENFKEEFLKVAEVIKYGLMGAVAGGLAGSFMRGGAATMAAGAAAAAPAAGGAVAAGGARAAIRTVLGFAGRGLGAMGGIPGMIVGGAAAGYIADLLLNEKDPEQELEKLYKEGEIDESTYETIKSSLRSKQAIIENRKIAAKSLGKIDLASQEIKRAREDKRDAYAFFNQQSIEKNVKILEEENKILNAAREKIKIEEESLKNVEKDLGGKPEEGAKYLSQRNAIRLERDRSLAGVETGVRERMFGTTPTAPTAIPSTPVSGLVEPYGGYNSREEFTKAMTPWAQKAAEELKVPTEAIISQWGSETGWGKKGAVQGQFNYGNIQGTYRESEPGLDAGRPRNFIKYSSMQDFVNDYVKQLKNPRYDLGKENVGSQQFFEKLKKGGYAEDPNYVANLMNITKDTKIASTPTMPSSPGTLTSAGVSGQQDATKKTNILDSLFGVTQASFEKDFGEALGAISSVLTMMGQSNSQLGNQISGAMNSLAESSKSPSVAVSVASSSVVNSVELKDYFGNTV